MFQRHQCPPQKHQKSMFGSLSNKFALSYSLGTFRQGGLDPSPPARSSKSLGGGGLGNQKGMGGGA